MKKNLIPAISIAIFGAINVAQGASFLEVANNSASSAAPWTLGVQFTVPAGSFAVVSQLSYFNNQAGNTIRVGLWNNLALNGYGNSVYASTLTSTGTGGFSSVGPLPTVASGAVSVPNAITLGAGSYTYSASGFVKPNSFGDTIFGDSVTAYSSTTQSKLTGVGDILSLQADPTYANPMSGSITTAQNRWKSVNFTYTVVPEPETYAMVAGAALVGFGLWRRRQS